MNFKEIFNAWKTRMNPTPKQEAHALNRLSICMDCPFKKTLINTVEVCSKCGCPIHGKMFSQQYDPCPEGKFKEIDDEYFGT